MIKFCLNAVTTKNQKNSRNDLNSNRRSNSYVEESEKLNLYSQLDNVDTKDVQIKMKESLIKLFSTQIQRNSYATNTSLRELYSGIIKKTTWTFNIDDRKSKQAIQTFYNEIGIQSNDFSFETLRQVIDANFNFNNPGEININIKLINAPGELSNYRKVEDLLNKSGLSIKVDDIQANNPNMRKKREEEEEERLAKEEEERLAKEKEDELKRKKEEQDKLAKEKADELKRKKEEQDRLDKEKADELKRKKEEQQIRLAKKREKELKAIKKKEEEDRLEKARKDQLDKEKAERDRLAKEEQDRLDKILREKEFQKDLLLTNKKEVIKTFISNLIIFLKNDLVQYINKSVKESSRNIINMDDSSNYKKATMLIDELTKSQDNILDADNVISILKQFADLLPEDFEKTQNYLIKNIKDNLNFNNDNEDIETFQKNLKITNLEKVFKIEKDKRDSIYQEIKIMITEYFDKIEKNLINLDINIKNELQDILKNINNEDFGYRDIITEFLKLKILIQFQFLPKEERNLIFVNSKENNIVTVREDQKPYSVITFNKTQITADNSLLGDYDTKGNITSSGERHNKFSIFGNAAYFMARLSYYDIQKEDSKQYYRPENMDNFKYWMDLSLKEIININTRYKKICEILKEKLPNLNNSNQELILYLQDKIKEKSYYNNLLIEIFKYIRGEVENIDIAIEKFNIEFKNDNDSLIISRKNEINKLKILDDIIAPKLNKIDLKDIFNNQSITMIFDKEFQQIKTDIQNVDIKIETIKENALKIKQNIIDTNVKRLGDDRKILRTHIYKIKQLINSLCNEIKSKTLKTTSQIETKILNINNILVNIDLKEMNNDDQILQEFETIMEILKLDITSNEHKVISTCFNNIYTNLVSFYKYNDDLKIQYIEDLELAIRIDENAHKNIDKLQSILRDLSELYPTQGDCIIITILNKETIDKIIAYLPDKINDEILINKLFDNNSINDKILNDLDDAVHKQKVVILDRILYSLTEDKKEVLTYIKPSDLNNNDNEKQIISLLKNNIDDAILVNKLFNKEYMINAFILMQLQELIKQKLIKDILNNVNGLLELLKPNFNDKFDKDEMIKIVNEKLDKLDLNDIADDANDIRTFKDSIINNTQKEILFKNIPSLINEISKYFKQDNIQTIQGQGGNYELAVTIGGSLGVLIVIDKAFGLFNAPKNKGKKRIKKTNITSKSTKTTIKKSPVL